MSCDNGSVFKAHTGVRTNIGITRKHINPGWGGEPAHNSSTPRLEAGNPRAAACRDQWYLGSSLQVCFSGGYLAFVLFTFSTLFFVL